MNSRMTSTKPTAHPEISPKSRTAQVNSQFHPEKEPNSRTGLPIFECRPEIRHKTRTRETVLNRKAKESIIIVSLRPENHVISCG